MLNRLRTDQRGFTMVTVVMVMMVLSMLGVAAYAAATGDMPLARKDQDRKRALEAAQAGVDWYVYRLRVNPDYWLRCADDADDQAPLTLEGPPKAGAPGWRTISGGSAKFRVEILDITRPNGTKVSCDTSNPWNTALQKGMLRIRATGWANGNYRTLIAQLQQTSEFLRYVYFSNWETMDPHISNVNGTAADGKSVCDRPRSARDAIGGGCVQIQFGGGDTVKGSIHTNDETVYACAVTFGRNASDAFETTTNTWYVGGSGGYSCSGGPPVFKATKRKVSSVDLPSGNQALNQLAAPAYTFTGQTCLDFHGSTVWVYKAGGSAVGHTPWKQKDALTGSGSIKCDGNYDVLPLPANGVIYVRSAGGQCPVLYGAFAKTSYTSSESCGDVAIRGTYSSGITIGAQNDIIVYGDIQRTSGSDALLGLIANNYVRVYHPMAGDPYTQSLSSGSSCSGLSSVSYPIVHNIDASILSLHHSFQVDNYGCGGYLGTLTMNGSLAQYYRGTVGTVGGSSTGYTKDYNYDDRLRRAQPPYFLAPANVEGRWQIVRRSEQTPAETAP